MTNIILCGGVGSRLWPLSRTHLPKQFARILPGDSLFEATVRRNLSLCTQILVASNRDQSFLAATQLRGLGLEQWKSVIEPVGRNTAPAIALACLMLPKDELVLVTPSDHLITKNEAYQVAVDHAMALALAGKLVTFGISPEYPETGFGYIQTKPGSPNEVLAFREKPDLEAAKQYLASGEYWWNSGMFCFTVGTYLSELALCAPEILRYAKIAHASAPLGEILEPALAEMRAIPAESIDYAVMEKSSRVACVTCNIGWSDMGSFDAIYDHRRQMIDMGEEEVDDGNALVCLAEPVIVNSRNNLVINGERTVALIDVEDLLVVESHDALLIAKRGSSQNVKTVVEQLKSRQSPLTEDFPVVERPWGNHSMLHEEAGFRVKRIQVAPGHRSSMRLYRSRMTHWLVVAGEALIQIGESRWHYGIGQSVTIPMGTLHRLENPGNKSLVLVETQIGENLLDTDIERVQDDYEHG